MRPTEDAYAALTESTGGGRRDPPLPRRRATSGSRWSARGPGRERRLDRAVAAIPGGKPRKPSSCWQYLRAQLSTARRFW